MKKKQVQIRKFIVGITAAVLTMANAGCGFAAQETDTWIASEEEVLYLQEDPESSEDDLLLFDTNTDDMDEVVSELENTLENGMPDDLIEDPEQDGMYTDSVSFEEEEEAPETIELDDNLHVDGSGANRRMLFSVASPRMMYAMSPSDAVEFFKKQLDASSRLLYEKRYDYYGSGSHTDNYTISFTISDAICKQEGCSIGNGFMEDPKDPTKTIIDRSSSQYIQMMEDAYYYSQAASDALAYDHPEIFWSRMISLELTPARRTASGEMYISKMVFKPVEAFSGAAYYADKYQARVSQEAQGIYDHADYNMDGSVSNLELIQGVHDFVCDSYIYDYNGLSTYEQTNDYHIFLPLGAFFREEMKDGVVCEGYAKTVKVLCDYFGIPCVIVGGKGSPSSSTGHMWNYIGVDGEWYLMDTTWDDNADDTFSYKYYLSGYCSDVSSRVNSGYISGRETVDKNGITHYKMNFAYPSLVTEKHVFENVNEAEAICIGYQQKECAADHIVYWEKVGEPKGHDYQQLPEVAPTCTEYGSAAGPGCIVCGKNDNAKIPPTGHHYEVQEGIEPTCAQEGLTTGNVCSVCGDDQREIIPALAHQYEEQEGIEPTCAQEGLTAGNVCSVCGDDQREVIPALGHKYEAKEGKAPTCLDKGWTAGEVCTVCGDDTREEIPATGHAFAETVLKAATCTEKGEREIVCTNAGCSEKHREEIALLEHQYEKASGAAPSCVKAGLTDGEICSVCKADTRKVIPAKGHIVGNDGNCTVCGQMITAVPAKMARPEAKILTTGKIKITAKGLKDVSGYEIVYKTKGAKAKTITVNVGKKVVNRKIKGLKAGKTYSVRIRAFRKCGNTKIYGKWSKQRKVKLWKKKK